MKIRPLTIFLLIALVLAGGAAGLYHFGVYDSILSGMQDRKEQPAGEGPVVRKEVSRLVLPLKSSQQNETDSSAAELRESDLHAGNSDKPADEPSAGTTENRTETTPEIQPTAVAENSTAEKSAPAEEKKESGKLPQAAASDRGKAGPLKVSCSAGSMSADIALTTKSGRVKWFNLNKPRRLVVDILGKWDFKDHSVYRLKSCMVEKIVVGEHPDKLRLVFYLKGTEIPARIAPSVKKSSGRLSLGLKF
ncbi:AMIN domain-containing protein [Maridesulfovibrio sp.]|uniref:AMIN domain-containing protein n=1 Tax=Maridesulfovibrio sp. TaxID=2795000 RepID=UPI002A1891FF|nr:AMIN domain-containing protein [Maridesulfovibrio sp.]